MEISLQKFPYICIKLTTGFLSQTWLPISVRVSQGSRMNTVLWRKEWLPAPVYLPGERYGQGSLVGYSPWGRKESVMTEQLTHIQHTHTQKVIFILRN